jgi:murein DD-endopeptidase MepM/ murein hydrolase activator NlpD
VGEKGGLNKANWPGFTDKFNNNINGNRRAIGGRKETMEKLLGVLSIIGMVYLFSSVRDCSKEHNAQNAQRIVQLSRDQAQSNPATDTTTGLTPAQTSPDKVARCEGNKPTFAKWISEEKDCAGTSLTPPLLCGLHDKESKMCLGTEGGDRCEVSEAGAVGPWQFMPSTFSGAWKKVKGKNGKEKDAWFPGVGFDGNGDGKADIYGFVDAGRSAVRYLCRLEKKVGSTDFLRAYNGGIEGYKEAVTKTTAYDKWIREKALSYGGNSGNNPVLAQAGTADSGPSAIAASSDNGKQLAYANGIASPLAIGDGCLTSTETEDRPGDREHHGFDYGAPEGTPVYAVADGIVRAASWHHDGKDKRGLDNPGERAGINVSIDHDPNRTKRPGSLASTGSMHLLRPLVRVGQAVKQGEVIGLVGKTAVFRSGSHLHFQMKKWNERGEEVLVENIAEFVNIAAFDAGSSLYKGPNTDSCRSYGEKFKKRVTFAMNQ